MGGLGSAQGQESLSDKLMAHLGLTYPPRLGALSTHLPSWGKTFGCKRANSRFCGCLSPGALAWNGYDGTVLGRFGHLHHCGCPGSHACLAPPQGLGGNAGEIRGQSCPTGLRRAVRREAKEGLCHCGSTDPLPSPPKPFLTSPTHGGFYTFHGTLGLKYGDRQVHSPVDQPLVRAASWDTAAQHASLR